MNPQPALIVLLLLTIVSLVVGFLTGYLLRAVELDWD
jgi:hypothetical protein